MSNGLLGKSMSNANGYVTLYTAPATVQYTSLVVNAVNTDGNNVASIRVAITTSPQTPGLLDHIEYGAQIPAAGGIFERTGLILSAGESIAVWSDNSNLAIRVSGLEKVA